MTRFPARWKGPLGASGAAGFLLLLLATPNTLKSQPQPGEREEIVKRLEGLAKDPQNPAAKKAAEDLVAFDRAHARANDGRLAESLKQLSDVRAAAGEDEAAILAAKEGVEVRRKASGGSGRKFATELLNLGELYVNTGMLEPAEPILEQSIAALATAIGNKDPIYAEALNDLAEVCRRRGDFSKNDDRRADKLFRDSLEILSVNPGDSHPRYANVAANYALLLVGLGDLENAERQIRKALLIFRRASAENRGDEGLVADLARCAQNLGYVTLQSGRADLALGPLMEARDLLKGLSSAQATEIRVAILANLALVYQAMGDWSPAEQALQEAITLATKPEGGNEQVVSHLQNNLAAVLQDAGYFTRAEMLYQQALATLRRLKLSKSLEAGVTDNLGMLARELGDFKTAERLFTAAYDSRVKALGKEHRDIATSLEHLGELYVESGDLLKAEKPLKDGLALLARYWPKGHLDRVIAQRNVGLWHLLRGEPAVAEQMFEKALEELAHRLDQLAPAMTDSRKLTMLRESHVILDDYITAARKRGAAPEAIYARVLDWKGAIFDRQRALRVHRDSPEVLRQRALLLANAKEQEAVWARWQNSASSVAECCGALEVLEQARERLESELAAAARSRRAVVRPSEIQQRLAAGEVLIDLVDYGETRWTEGPGRRVCREPKLLAFVVRPEGPIEVVDLGESATVEDAVDRWRAAIGADGAGGRNDDGDLVDSADREIYGLVRKPLEPHLIGARAVLISPDGALSRFPLAALPGRDLGSYLLDEVPVVVVTLPRLLRGEVKSSRGDRDLLLVGDLESTGSATAATRGGRQSLPPVVADEIDPVADSFRRYCPGWSIDVLRGRSATVEAVLARLPGSRLIHLATHAFGELPRRGRLGRSRSPRAGCGAATPERHRSADARLHPGLRSGLVLARGNAPAAGAESNVLTALRVAELDLSGSELVVLSGCQTGIGAEEDEGPLGLQRAFQVAQARMVIASMWEVDNATTRWLMTRFYDALWREGLTPEEALRAAQRALRAQLGERADPGLWAAWQVSGEPGTHVSGMVPSRGGGEGARGLVVVGIGVVAALVAVGALVVGSRRRVKERSAIV